MGEAVRVASTRDIPPGEGRAFEVGGRQIAVFHAEDGRFYAIDNECRHQGGPLAEGELDGNLVSCPWHAWVYEIDTGKCHDDPACSVATYPVRVEGDAVIVEIPER